MLKAVVKADVPRSANSEQLQIDPAKALN